MVSRDDFLSDHFGEEDDNDGYDDKNELKDLPLPSTFASQKKTSRITA